MSLARIFRPAKTAMQSGKAETHHWHLEFETAQACFIEPLMGWTGSRDTHSQVVLKFSSREAAIAFAEQHQLAYLVEPEPTIRPRRRAYADNFAYNRQR